MEAMRAARAGMPGQQWASGPQNPQMMQQPVPGQQQPMGTPQTRNEMPPPQAPAAGANAARTNPSSPQPGNNAPPTPSLGNKANPKGKKEKNEQRKVSHVAAHTSFFLTLLSATE